MAQSDKFRVAFDEYDSIMNYEMAEYNLRKTFISLCEEEEPEAPYQDMWKDFTNLYLKHGANNKAELINMRRIGEALEEPQILQMTALSLQND